MEIIEISAILSLGNGDGLGQGNGFEFRDR